MTFMASPIGEHNVAGRPRGRWSESARADGVARGSEDDLLDMDEAEAYCQRTLVGAQAANPSFLG